MIQMLPKKPKTKITTYAIVIHTAPLAGKWLLTTDEFKFATPEERKGEYIAFYFDISYIIMTDNVIRS